MPRLKSSSISSYFDIIVVGSGAAGLYAALCLPAHLRVALVTKNTINMGSSNYAQGGIAAAIDPSDNPKLHRVQESKSDSLDRKLLHPSNNEQQEQRE